MLPPSLPRNGDDPRFTKKRNSYRQCINDRCDRLLRLGAHFIVSGILDGMRHKDVACIFHSKCAALEIGGFFEL